MDSVILIGGITIEVLLVTALVLTIKVKRQLKNLLRSF
jgi:hypothetical protein